jgi:hypothetical protein
MPVDSRACTFCEAARLFPEMGFGLQDGLGHYIDLSCAVLGLILFPVGYLLDAYSNHRP